MSEIGDALVQNLTEATVSWQVHRLLVVLASYAFPLGQVCRLLLLVRLALAEKHAGESLGPEGCDFEVNTRAFGVGAGADFTSQQKGCQGCACQMAASGGSQNWAVSLCLIENSYLWSRARRE